jgi:hypothetical protein
VRLLDATTRWGLLTGLLGSVGLTGSLTSGRLTSGLLSTSHFRMILKVNEEQNESGFCRATEGGTRRRV